MDENQEKPRATRSGAKASSAGKSATSGADTTPVWGELLRKAVQLGAGAYVSAEDRVQRTISTVQAPFTLSKEIVKELLDNFMQSYSIRVNAQIDFVPKKKDNKEEEKT